MGVSWLIGALSICASNAWGQAATTTTLTSSSVNPAFINQNTLLKATVAGASPTGTVTFKDGATILAYAGVAGGIATANMTFSTAGAHALTATYGGDTANAASTSAAFTQTVNPPGATTTAFTSSSVNPAFINQNTLLTAMVTGSSPTGTVTFKDGATILAYAGVTGGVATANVTFSSAGAHALTAAYGGDLANATSSSGTLTQTVNAPGATTTVFTSSSVNPALINQNTLLKATVTGANPSGTVTFKDGVTILAYAGVSGGIATANVTFPTAGAHALTASYGGDLANATSTSTAFTQTVNAPGATTTAFTSSSVNPALVNQNTLLTATLTGASPTGTVTFKDGSTILAYAGVTAGIATANVTFSTAGAHALTASYGGDLANATSTSTAFTQTVNAPGATTTAFTSSSLNPALVNQNTLLTATLTGASPTGTVTFKDGSTILAYAGVTAGRATANVTFSTAGAHALTAAYGGDLANAPSASAAFTQTVNAPVATTTVFTSSSVNPAFINQNTLVKATITGASPTGTVTFKDGATILAYAGVTAGIATANVTFSTAGTHTLTAAYGGDLANGLSASAAFTQTVNAPGATMTVFTSSSVNPAFINQNTLLKATISGASPTGTVTFKDGATILAYASVSAGIATANVTFSTAGTHPLTAAYGGDLANAASTSSAFTQTVTVASPTTTALTSTANPSVVTQNTTLRATVTGSNPTGTVTFKDGATSIGSAGVSAGVATLTTSFSTSGAHSVTAVYGGDSLNATSTSPILTQTVNLQGTTTTTALISSVNPAYVSQSATLTATVTGAAPTGTVTFKDGVTTLGAAGVSAGVATLATTFSAAGAHSLTAMYGGDVGNTTSTSAALSETINARTTSSTTLMSSVNPSSTGQSTTLTATVTGSAPTGSVTFSDGGSPLGTVTLTGGTATLNRTFTTIGVHSLIAAYSGDMPNTGSTSAALGQNVVPGNMTWIYGYDPEGNVTAVTNPLSNATTTTYDRLMRAIRIVQPPPVTAAPTPTINIGYDGQDNVTSIQDPRSLTTSFVSDGLSNVKSQLSPDSGTTNATYDASRNLLTRTDARGITTTYTYDVRNRVKTISYPTGTGTVYEYDGGASPYPGSIDKLTKLTDESGVTTFTYDALGRLVGRSALVNGKTLTVGYTWGATGTATGKITSITYPSKARINYGYDAAGRVQSLTVNPPSSNGASTNTGSYLSILSGITYNADSSILGWTWANNAPYSRTYDSFGRITSFPVGYPMGTGIASGLTRGLAYDGSGRVTAYNHSDLSGAQVAFNQGFAYDALDRLVQQSSASLTYTYAYDATGNRTGLTLGANNYVNTVSTTSNRLTVVQTAGTGGTPVNNNQVYANSGGLTADGTATYIYNDRGRMSSSTAGGQNTVYKYNGLEQRVSKVGSLVPTGAAYYAYDEAGKTLGEYDATLYPVAETVYVGTTPVAVLKETGSATASTLQLVVGNAYADQIDTPRVITRNSDEAILWRWDGTEAFGNSPAQENPSGLGSYKYNQRMPGQVYDAEDQNFYNWNRDYQPRTGRYAQSDPIGLGGGINTYAYVNGNPIGLSDLMGLAARLGGGACASAITSSNLRTRDEVIRELLFALRDIPGLEATGEPKLGANWGSRRGVGVPIKPEIQVVLIFYDIEFVKYKTFRLSELIQHLLTWCKYKTRDQCGNEGEETQYSESDQIVNLSRDLISERFSSERSPSKWSSVPFPLP